MTVDVAERKMSLGQRIKIARKETFFTIAQLAFALGVDPRTVARWQADEARPSIDRLMQIALVLGKSPSYFLDEVAA